MAYGTLVADNVVMLTDKEHGKPVVETAEPGYVPAGYVSKGVWVDTGTQLMLVYDIVPEEGTAEEAALALSRMQYQSLPNDAAYELRALAPELVTGQSYAAGTKVRSGGRLYTVDADGVADGDVSEICTEVMPTSSADEWSQPSDKHTYNKGSLVTHNGVVYRSVKNNNTDDPGTSDKWEVVQ